MGPSRLPPWLTVLARRRQRIDPTRGIPLRSVALGRQPGSLSNDEIGRSRRRGGSRTRHSKDTPEGVIERLEDFGLSPDEIDKVVNEEPSDSFDPFSPSDLLSGAGDVLSGALRTLDVPRAALMSGLVEASDVVDAALGDRSIEGTDRLRQTGVSWEDLKENFNNRVGFADVLEASTDDDLFGVPTDNPLVRAGIGFATDVASDPLNYLGVGLADDVTKLAKLFRNPGAIAALGKDAADEAGRKALQRGATSLNEQELAAIGRKGGLYFKTPGTGAVGRTLKLDKVLGSPERYTTLARRGTVVGDAASGLAQAARRGSGLNSLMRVVGGGAAKRGLAGDLGALRAGMRGADDRFGALDSLVTVTKSAEARHLGEGFRARKLNKYKALLATAKAEGVDGTELFHAIGGAANQASRQHLDLVRAFQDFMEELRVEANTLGGREFIPRRDNYVPRVLTDEAREEFGINAQARGKGGTRSMTRKRQYVAGSTIKVGKGKNAVSIKLIDPLDPKSGGLSIEEQIENALAMGDQTQWFKNDALEAVPDYVEKLSRQVSDEYLGNELKRLQVGREMWVDKVDDIPAQMDDVRVPRSETGLTRRRYQKLSRDLAQAQEIVKQYGKTSSRAKALPWRDIYQKSALLGSDWEPQVRSSLNDLLQQTGEQWAQFGTGTALPADMVSVLRDVGKMSEPGAFPRVMALHDKALNLWKKMALLSPGYHWRNSFGGVFMNWLGDVDEGRYLQLERLIAHDPDNAPFFGKGARVTKGKSGDPRKGVLPINDPELQAAYDEAKRLGLFTGGQSVEEIEQAVDPKTPLHRVFGAPFRGSRRMGGSIENRLRGAMFIDEYIKNGGDSGLAFDKVQKYHFDYQALGQRERQIRRVGVPFYTFTRRSVPLMLEMIVRNPGKINRYFQAKDNIERLSQEEGIVPEYFTRNFAIRMPWESDNGQTYMMPDLPLFSLIDASDPNQALGQVSPFLKTPLELGTGQQVWKGIPLESDPVEIPAAVRWLTPALRLMNRTNTDADGNEVMSERDLYAIQQFLPQIGQYRRLFPTEDKYEDRRMTSVLSFLFGVNARTNTPDEQANELWRRYDPYADDIQYQEDLGYERDEARDIAFS